LLIAAAVLILVVVVVLRAASCASPAQETPQAPATAQQPPAELPAPGTTLTATPAESSTQATAATSTPVVEQAATGTPAGPMPSAVPPSVGEPNRIVIPKIDLDAPMVDVGWEVVERGDQRYTEWQTADNAAGHHVNSARPGEQGNVVLSGHHNTKGEVFRRISDMELAIGDSIYLYDASGQRFTYVVDEITDPPLQEVGASPEQRLANARYIQPTNDARVTLVTCWPYVSNTHRVVVVGKLVQ
jgi:sortase A